MRALCLMPLAALLCSSSPSPAPKAAPAPKTVMITVANRAMRVGETVQLADVVQISVPSAWVTSSIVKPESANYIVGRKLRLPVAAGDPMLWVDFEALSDPAKCLEAIGPEDTALEQIARHRAALLGARR